MKFKSPNKSALSKQLSDATKRIAHLERVCFSRVSRQIEAKDIIKTCGVVHVVFNYEGEVAGVFLSDTDAQHLADKEHGHMESWVAQPEIAADAAPIRYLVGQRVYGIDEETSRVFTGTIIWCDDDESQGIEKILYKVVRDGFTSDSEASIIITGAEIKQILAE